MTKLILFTNKVSSQTCT